MAATQTAADLCAALDAVEAEAQALLGRQLIEDCVDARTGELHPIAVVTDNGPAMKSIAVARWFAHCAHFTHVRTRHRSPHTNGVIERWFEALKYEHLYREDIPDGIDLTEHVAAFTDEYKRVRPREALRWQRPLDTQLSGTTLKPNRPKLSKILDSGQSYSTLTRAFVGVQLPCHTMTPNRLVSVGFAAGHPWQISRDDRLRVVLWGVVIVHSAEVTLVRDARLGHSPSIGERCALVVISWSVW